MISNFLSLCTQTNVLFLIIYENDFIYVYMHQMKITLFLSHVLASHRSIRCCCTKSLFHIALIIVISSMSDAGEFVLMDLAIDIV